MRKAAILILLLGCDGDDPSANTCRDWLVCYDECRAFEDVRVYETACFESCGAEWRAELPYDVWSNDSWLEDTIAGKNDALDPSELYVDLRDARRACYSAP